MHVRLFTGEIVRRRRKDIRSEGGADTDCELTPQLHLSDPPSPSVPPSMKGGKQ